MDKLERYKQLSAMDTADQTDEEIQEQVDLYYELYVQKPEVDGDGLDQLGQRLWNEVEALERLDMFLDGDRESCDLDS